MRHCAGGTWPTCGRARRLRSSLWRVRGNANSGDRSGGRTSTRRVAFDFSSVLAGRGEMSISALLVSAWVGSVMGDNLGYLIGRKLGRGAVLRYGAKVGLTSERFSRIESTYIRYGYAAVLFARFFSILRQLNGILAGMLGMPWWRFALIDSIGAALWVMVWVFAPAYFSEHLTVIIGLAHHTKVVVSVLVGAGLILVLGFFIRRLRVAGWTARQ